jgi:hypothetical protein
MRPPPLPDAPPRGPADAYRFLVRAGLFPAEVSTAVERAAALGVAPQQVFLREGLVTADA